jgi:SAM-dependent methyltransferase
MDRVATYPGFVQSKARARALLAGVGRVLDVGCGVGDDVRALGPGSVGVDPSRTMLRIARSRGGAFVLGGGQRLPFRSGVFDGVRADRVLQHVEDPERVTDELVRVVARGAPVVVIDPDQATLVIDGPDPALTDVVVQFRVNGVRNGFLAGRMTEVLRNAGCRDVVAERFVIELTDPARAFGLPTWATLIVDKGGWTTAEAARFNASLEASVSAGTFRYRTDLVLTWGHRI